MQPEEIQASPRRNYASSQPFSDQSVNSVESGSSNTSRDLIPVYLKWGVAILVLMILFPPFYRALGEGRGFFLGYGFIFDPPSRATVDVTTLLVQALFLILVLAVLIGLEIYKKRGATLPTPTSTDSH